MYSIIACLVILGGIIAGIYATYRSNYQKLVADFKTIRVTEVPNLIKNQEKTLIYIGRETCPACVEFVPILSSAVKKTNIPIYYLDSTQSKTDEDFMRFKQTYGVIQVPTLMFINKGEARLLDIGKTESDLIELFHVLFRQEN